MTLPTTYLFAFFGLVLGVPLTAFGAPWCGVPLVGVALVVVWREYRADPWAAWLFCALTFGLLAAGHGLLWAVLGSAAAWRSGLVQAVLCAVAVGAVVGWARIRTAGLKDILGDWFGPESVYENNQVQWAVRLPSSVLSSTSVVELYLQNCSAAERRCEVLLEEGSRRPLKQGGLNYPRPFMVTLGVGHVVRCTIPVQPTGHESGDMRLFFQVVPRGARAPRNRSARGQVVRGRLSLRMQIVQVVLSQSFVRSGGVFVAFQSAQLARACAAAELEAKEELLWSPDATPLTREHESP